jgi:hypothetical protein
MTKKEYLKEWNKKYFSIPENKEKRRLASAKFRKKNPDYFKQEKIIMKARKSALDWYRKNPERSKNNNWNRKLVREYGISRVEYDKMLESQKGLCAICYQPDTRKLSVDHNHQTGRVRELLCSRCNTSIGLLDENVERLNNMMQYLIKHLKI